MNDSYVKLVKVKGEFVWHNHEEEDGLFLIMKGRLTIKTRNRDVDLQEGELAITPRGVEAQALNDDGAHIMPWRRNAR